MTTVSTSFTAVGVSASLRLQAEEEVTFSLSGTYDATIQVERATTPDEKAWEVVLGPFSTANATVSRKYRTRRNESLRVRCAAFTSGTAVTSIADGDAILREERDEFGVVKARRTEAKEYFAGDVEVGGNLTVTGKAAVSAQPFLSAYQNASSAGVTGDGTDHQVIYNTESVNQGGVITLNTSTGLITVSEAGIYSIKGFVSLYGFAGTTGHKTEIVAGGITYRMNLDKPLDHDDAGGSVGYQFDLDVLLAANDTIAHKENVSGAGSKVTFVDGNGTTRLTRISVLKKA